LGQATIYALFTIKFNQGNCLSVIHLHFIEQPSIQLTLPESLCQIRSESLLQDSLGWCDPVVGGDWIIFGLASTPTNVDASVNSGIEDYGEKSHILIRYFKKMSKHLQWSKNRGYVAAVRSKFFF